MLLQIEHPAAHRRRVPQGCTPTMKWRVGQEQISPWPPKEREADLAGEDYFGAAGNGLSQSTIRAQRRKS